MQCNGVLSLGYTGAYFDAACVAAQIDNLKKLSPHTVEKLVEAYCDRVTENKVSLVRQVSSPPLNSRCNRHFLIVYNQHPVLSLCSTSLHRQPPPPRHVVQGTETRSRFPRLPR